MRKFLSLLSLEYQPKANWSLWIAMTLVFAVIVWPLKWFFPDSIPYGFWELWSTKGSIGDWMYASWPLLAWGSGLVFFVSAFSRNSRAENNNAENYLRSGLWTSLRAGLMEEIIFRWLLFMLSIVMVQVGDFIAGGWLFPHGFVWVVNEFIVLPIANFVTLGYLQEVLYDQNNWYIAVAVIAANAQFRDGHKYQGPIGYINSWFGGMYFFYLLFQYGLLACIVVHLAYDVFIDGIRYVDRVIERARNK